MKEITLKVTTKVIDQVSLNGDNQRQISICSPQFDEANKNNKIIIKIGGVVSIVIGDTSAIWASHNKEQKSNFGTLYNLLSEYPDKEVKFLFTN